MNAKSLIGILVATTSIGLSTNRFSPSSYADTVVQVEASDATAYPKDRVSFYCAQIPDTTDGGTIPATVAYVPQRQANVQIIGWKTHIPAWDTQRRCETVSPKFQAFYEEARLNYLTTGVKDGYDIVCAAPDRGQPCGDEDQLFQVKASNDPKAVLKALTGIIEGTASQPIYQSSGDRVYVSVEELLNAAPAIEEGDLTSN